MYIVVIVCRMLVSGVNKQIIHIRSKIFLNSTQNPYNVDNLVFLGFSQFLFYTVYTFQEKEVVRIYFHK